MYIASGAMLFLYLFNILNHHLYTSSPLTPLPLFCGAPTHTITNPAACVNIIKI